MRTQHLITFFAMALGVNAVGACGSATPATESSTGAHSHGGGGGGGEMEKMGEMCPMAVAGTSVAASDVDGGVALVFTTSGDVDQVRQRVRHMAEMHDRGMMQSHEGGMGGGGMGGGGMGGGKMDDEHGMMGKEAKGMEMEMMPETTASAEDVDGGARLTLLAKDPAQVDALRSHVRMHAERMQSGDCPMMAPDAAPTTAPVEPSAGDEHTGHHPPTN